MADQLSWQDKLASIKGDFPDEASSPTVDDSTVDTCRVPGDKLEIVFERKGRGGKSATIIAGFKSLDDSELKELASEMKSRLATGGSVRGGEILIQGDRRDDVKNFLKERGFRC